MKSALESWYFIWVHIACHTAPSRRHSPSSCQSMCLRGSWHCLGNSILLLFS